MYHSKRIASVPQARLDDGAPKARRVLYTRGNVDGQIAGAMALRRHSATRIQFHSHSSKTIEELRRRIGESHITILDMGLDEALLSELNRKARLGAHITYVDHHATSKPFLDRLHPNIEAYHDESISAGHLAWSSFGAWADLESLAAIADAGDRIQTLLRRSLEDTKGDDFLQHEAEVLDFSWRYNVQDDVYRHLTARRMACGLLPSQIAETRRRYAATRSSEAYQRACRLATENLLLRRNVGYLDGARTRSLNGFGSLALQYACKDRGASVGCRINWRGGDAIVSLRRYKGHLNAGRFLQDFAESHDASGGGHPEAAGGRMTARLVPRFRSELESLA
jgi:single-stranded-DNA-specific exonuclease